MISPEPETKKVSLDTELRNAAAKLRKHVKHATESPWVTSSVWSPRATSTSAVYSHAHPTGTVESEADKVLAATPLRPVTATEVLS